MKGEHNIEIMLDNRKIPSAPITLKTVDFSPPTVEYTVDDSTVHFVDTSNFYEVYLNGEFIGIPVRHSYHITHKSCLQEYMILTKDSNGYASFAGRPLVVTQPEDTYLVEAEKFASKSDMSCKGFSGKGFIEISKTKNTVYNFSVTVDKQGTYFIDFRYANGTGPVNTDNNCAIRTLKYEGQKIGAVVFPQRGKDEWSNWGYSNELEVYLKKGENRFTLSFEPYDENMDGEINTAMIDQIRLVKKGE
jgi:hypothetical protein